MREANEPAASPGAPQDVKAITRALSTPFAPSEVKWKPQSVKGSRAMALAYIDARLIQDRLDDVLGVEGWQDEYELLPDGSVMCKLRLWLGGQWVTKVDVGSPSEQPDGGDRLKAAFSDALKRAAVKFGVGRYIYRLPVQWADYDPQTRKFTHAPSLPAWAIPPKTGASAPAPRKTPDATAPPALPKDGAELDRRLRAFDSKAAAEGKFPAGALLEAVRAAGVKAGYGANILGWDGPAIMTAVDAAKSFLSRPPAQPAAEKRGAKPKRPTEALANIKALHDRLGFHAEDIDATQGRLSLPPVQDMTAEQADAYLAELVSVAAAEEDVAAPGNAPAGGELFGQPVPGTGGVPPHVKEGR